MSARRRRIGSEVDHDLVISASNVWVDTSSKEQPNNYATHLNYVDEGLTHQQELPPVLTMTSRDRTTEFANAIRSLQNSSSTTRLLETRSYRQSKHLQNYSNFMLISKNIGQNIANTYAKLEKLALLAKRRSIFDDRRMEMEELTNIIKTDLGSLNQQIAKLQELGRKQRETFTTSRSHHVASHSSSVVVALQSKLASMSNHFKSVLEVRSENMKEEQNRREQFTQGNVSTLMPSVVSGKQSSLLLQEEQDNAASVSIDLEPAMGQLNIHRAVYENNDSYVQSRAETMQNIESTIVELGGIFQQLAHMVKEQEEMVERIDTNIEDAELNVEAAHTEILKYFQSVTNNRWLMIKIFAVLIFFCIFFIIFLA